MFCLKSFFRNTSGQALTEYALILAVIAVAVVAVMVSLGDQIQAVFQNITDGLSVESTTTTN